MSGLAKVRAKTALQQKKGAPVPVSAIQARKRSVPSLLLIRSMQQAVLTAVRHETASAAPTVARSASAADELRSMFRRINTPAGFAEALPVLGMLFGMVISLTSMYSVTWPIVAPMFTMHGRMTDDDGKGDALFGTLRACLVTMAIALQEETSQRCSCHAPCRRGHSAVHPGSLQCDLRLPPSGLCGRPIEGRGDGGACKCFECSEPSDWRVGQRLRRYYLCGRSERSQAARRWFPSSRTHQDAFLKHTVAAFWLAVMAIVAGTTIEVRR